MYTFSTVIDIDTLQQVDCSHFQKLFYYYCLYCLNIYFFPFFLKSFLFQFYLKTIYKKEKRLEWIRLSRSWCVKVCRFLSYFNFFPLAKSSIFFSYFCFNTSAKQEVYPSICLSICLFVCQLSCRCFADNNDT